MRGRDPISSVDDPGDTGDVGPLVVTQEPAADRGDDIGALLGAVGMTTPRNGYNLLRRGPQARSRSRPWRWMAQGPEPQSFTTMSMTAGMAAA